MVTDTFPLSEGLQAFQRATDSDALKVLLDVTA